MESLQFDLSPYSFVAVPLFIITSAVAYYTLRIKEKTTAIWWAIAALTSIPLGMASLFFSSLIPKGIALMPMTDAFAVFSMAASIEFGYRYPERIQSLEARLAEIFAGGVSLIAFVYSSYFAYQALINQIYGLPVSPAYWFLNPFAFLVALGVLIRRTIAVHKEVHGGGWREALRAGWHPQSRPARVLRNFSLALSSGLIQGLTSGLSAAGLIHPPADAYAIGFSMLVMVVVIVYAVFDLAPQQPSLIARLVGLSLVTLLTVLGTVGLYDIQTATERVAGQRIAEVEIVRRTVQSADQAALPDSLVYLIAWPRSDDVGSDFQDYRLIYSRVADFDLLPLLEERRLRASGALPLSANWGGYYIEELLHAGYQNQPVQLFFGSHPLGSYHQYAGYTFAKGDYEYEAGFSLAAMSQIVLDDGKRMLYAVVAGSLFILFVFPLFFRANLVQPLNRLLAGVRQADAGDLNISVPISHGDEIGFLTAAFNKMAASLRTSELRLRNERDFAASLAESVGALTATLNLNQVLDRILEAVSRIVPNDAASIALIEGGIARPVRWRGYERFGMNEIMPTFQFDIADTPTLQQMMKSHVPVFISDTHDHANWANFPGMDWVHSYAGAPIIVHGNVTGFLNVDSAEPEFYTVEHAQALRAFAGYVAAAIENARLYESAQRELAERQRAEAEVRELNISLEQRVDDRTRELVALYEVTDIASRVEDLKTMLAEIAARMVDSLHSDMCMIYFLEENEQVSPRGCLRLVASQASTSDLEPPDSVRVSPDSLLEALFVNGEALLIPDVTLETRLPDSLRAGGRRALILAPLQADGWLWGVIGVLQSAARGYTVEEIALISSIADQVGSAVQRDRLRRLAGQAALLQERQRVARDLHDSIAQSLYGLVTLAEAGQARAEKDSWDNIGSTLNRIGETARQAIKEMRLFIHQSRPSVLEDEGLVGALHQRLAAVEGRADTQARLLADEIALPMTVQEPLYYIAQEALNNTLKHARAATVTVHLREEGDTIILEICDDGCGFNPADVGEDGMGLSNMMSRAEEVGGRLELTSASEEGTRVKIIIPRERRADE